MPLPRSLPFALALAFAIPATLAGAQTGPAARMPSGAWTVRVSRPGGQEMAVRMDFEPRGAGRWEAFSRPGAIDEFLGWRKAMLARVAGKRPPRGALVRIENGTATQVGDSVRIRGRLASPFLGEHHLDGTIHGGRLRAELRRDSLGATTGTLEAVPAGGDRPVRDYRALAATVRRTVSERIYDPQLVRRADWRDFLDELDRRLGRARDDVDAMAAFYAIRPRLRTSHFDLFRNPEMAGTPLDSLLRAQSGDPATLVAVTFPAPGVALLRVRRWDRVTPLVARAFARIDSARPHTLVIDIRGNPGGDVSSASAAAHLLRDSTTIGVFLGRKWYAAHREPPTAAELASLPTISNDESVGTVLYGVREHGALVGVVPPERPRFDGTVYVLIDKETGSASEPLAYLLKSTRRATLVGERTAGAMLSAPPQGIGDGWVLRVPEADYFAADGTRLEGVGVEPDVAAGAAGALGVVGERIRAEHPYAGALLVGQGHADAARWAEAERAYRAVLAAAPDSAAAQLGLGAALGGQKRWDEALAVYEAAVARHPRDQGLRYQLGRAAAISGQRLEQGERALRAYLAEPVPAGSPSHAAAQWRLGLILQARGDLEGARRAFQAALVLEPQHAEAQTALRTLGR